MDHNHASLPTRPHWPSKRSRSSRFANRTSTQPIEERQRQVRQWISLDRSGKPPAEDDHYYQQVQGQENGDFEPVSGVQLIVRLPGQNQGSHDQSAETVTDPPRQPERPEGAPFRRTTKAEAEISNGRTHHWRQNRRTADEPHHIGQ